MLQVSVQLCTAANHPTPLEPEVLPHHWVDILQPVSYCPHILQHLSQELDGQVGSSLFCLLFTALLLLLLLLLLCLLRKLDEVLQLLLSQLLPMRGSELLQLFRLHIS